MHSAGSMLRGRPLLIVLGLIVGAVFAYLAVRNVRADETWSAFTATHFAWLVPAVLLLVLAFFVRAIRWWSLFAPSRRPPVRQVVRATFVGYLANTLLPARAGEAARTVALNRLARVPVAETVATILIERAYDVLSLILLLFLMLPGLPAVSWVRGAGIFAAILLAVIVVVAVVVLRFDERPLRILLRPLRWLPFVPREFADGAPRSFVHGLAGLLRARVAVLAFLLTTLSWIVVGVSYWLVMVAFDLHLSVLAGELVVIGIGLALILPSAPAALGVFEGATVVVLDAYHVDSSRALSYALLLHALNVLPLFAAAVVALAARRIRREASGRSVLADLESPAR